MQGRRGASCSESPRPRHRNVQAQQPSSVGSGSTKTLLLTMPGNSPGNTAELLTPTTPRPVADRKALYAGGPLVSPHSQVRSVLSGYTTPKVRNSPQVGARGL